jgi:hypothetical protein
MVFLLVVVSALVVTNATTGASGHQTAKRAVVSLSSTAPVTVTGSGFAPRERVTVRVALGGDTGSRVARATRGGRFVVQFPGVTMPECVSTVVMVVATGSRSRASVRGRTIPPPCGAPINP